MLAKELEKLIENPGMLDHDTLNDLCKLVEDYPFFQTGWLLYLKNLKQIKSPEYEKVLRETAIRIPDRKMLFRFLNNNYKKNHINIIHDKNDGVVYELPDTGETKQGNSLIDKFLSAETREINSGARDTENLSNSHINDLINNSSTENDEIITETLATLLFQQKNYDKALEAYKKLSLKYPEKSVYFATRIEEIEKLKNI